MSQDVAATTCLTCNGRGRLACPGPSKTNAERTGRMTVDWCYGMHMGHDCPDCGGAPTSGSRGES